ncbi:MAG: histidinol dehydrogenase [Pyrinomonadaceae bacterium]|nr:histidinol dehydrogenase [Pyrinomonadaceae bacterium]
MKTYYYPKKSVWREIVERPTFETTNLETVVSKILDEIKVEGDIAVRRYTQKFDNADVSVSRVSVEELDRAESEVSDELKQAIKIAKANIEKFHLSQIEEKKVVETTKGVLCWRESRPIERVGLYIPGGTAPLFSTVLMLAIPAKIAGCREIVLCSPPDANGEINPAILFTARLCGVENIFKIGGVQAVGAMAFGTETVPKVDKIFGPGNQYVTQAKQLVARNGVALDMPAGPSEVGVLADETAIPGFVAADLLSQAEHGIDSQVLLITTSKNLIEETQIELQQQLAVLPRLEIAAKALQNSRLVLVEDIQHAIDLMNEYAAEHLIIACKDSEIVADKIISAGSIFLGNYSCESAGDYASGTNHTLPTNGYARTFSGVSIDSFVKKVTFQKLSAEGIKNLGTTVEIMAEAEHLQAHKNAVTLRLREIER